MLKRLFLALGLVVFAAISVLRVARPPRPLPATVADTLFSAERAMRHVQQIAQRPHAMGTADHDRVRDYLLGELNSLGLQPQVQLTTAVGTRYQEAGRVQNIMARVPGREPNGKALLIMVHYDGVEAGPAASDDAVGAAALLETLRALRAANRPLAHDVIALFTDGEESGLLGAAAFVREHPWAKDVAVVINFEARGTTGRSLMFETGPGNLDVAQAFRGASDATAASVYATIYRLLPNDTDLSELAVLGLPALNFAFADGVERYHTSNDNLTYLNPGSLQHHGSHMLEMTRVFASESLPRKVTGDGVFFDLPLIGLIVYSQALEVPLALLALIMVAVVVWRERHGAGAGVLLALTSLILAATMGWSAGKLLAGPAVWSGVYALGVALLAVAVTMGSYAFAARRLPVRGLQAGALVIWVLLAVAVSMRAPGVGYLFTWPLLFAAAALMLQQQSDVPGYVAAAVTLLMLAGFIYGVVVIMLGLAGAGSIALSVVVSLIVLVLLPQLDVVTNNRRVSGAAWFAGGGVACFLVGFATVHATPAHPLRSALVYAQNADETDAWLGSTATNVDGWTRAIIGNPAAVSSPAWGDRLFDRAGRFAGRKVQRVAIDAPSATVLGDSTIDGSRHIVLRVSAARGSTSIAMRVTGAKVLASSVDGRAVSTARYREQSPVWFMNYWAVPDSGAVIALTVAAGAPVNFAVSVRRPGIPALAGVSIPERPLNIVPSQTGDVTVVYRQWKF